ncbi:MAG: E3 binding domain-containing protein, partial [Chloroflexi bacterium]|nr:E3 binding domain-containing protein [Chloroflexota bacterium]
MATLIKLPQFGVTMTEATVVAWLKSVGDTVERGDAVANIETDKLNQEVMATASGILRRIVVPVGGVAKVMEALAVLGTASEPESAIDAALGVAAPVVPATKTEPAKAPASASSSTAPNRAEDEGAAVRASPLARRLAGELGVNLARVQGSGPGGRIVEEDVRTAAASGQAGGWILASPLARRLAKDAGVDLGSVTGSGPEGRIVERDIQALIAAHEVSAPATTSSSAPVQATPAHAPSIAAG